MQMKLYYKREPTRLPTWVLCREELVYTLNKVLGTERTFSSSSDQTPYSSSHRHLQSLTIHSMTGGGGDLGTSPMFHEALSLVLCDEGLVLKIVCNIHRV